MSPDPRCCGTGTCIINPEGECWCGQKWDGEKMARPPLLAPLPRESLAPTAHPRPGAEPSADFDDA